MQAFTPRAFEAATAVCTEPALRAAAQEAGRPAKRRRPAGAVQLVAADAAAVLAEMAVMGAGLVQSIHVVEQE